MAENKLYYLNKYFREMEELNHQPHCYFNSYADNIDFYLFCLFYSIRLALIYFSISIFLRNTKTFNHSFWLLHLSLVE